MKYKYESKKIICENNKEKIYGVLYKPLLENVKIPTVIFSHGFNGSNNSGTCYAKYLAEHGIAVYCFDFRGGSSLSKSQGSTKKMSVFTEKSDLYEVLKVIKSFKFVDKDNVFLIGESQGGLVSAMLASEKPEEIKGLILLYPALCIVDDAKKRYGNYDNIPDSEVIMGMEIGKEYYKNLFDYNIYNEITRFDKEVLVIHGDNDNLVNISYSKEVVKKYNRAELKIIKGAGHGFIGEEIIKVLDYIMEYLKKYI